MKYDQKKIKREHGTLKEFDKLLAEIAKIDAVSRLIPGRISRKQSGSSAMRFSHSYMTESGAKFLMKKGSTAQELFVIMKNENKETLVAQILGLMKGM